MLIGTKIGPQDNEKSTEAKSRIADFFEIYGDMQCEYKILENPEKPIVVHFPHFKQGVNFADPKKEKTNEASLDWSKKMADKFNSKKIIIHPELEENKNCSVGVLINFIKNHHDSRLLIENTPSFSFGFRNLCNNYEDIKRVIEACNIGFCLDMTHAFTYAVMSGMGPKKHLEKLLTLKPSHFHVSDSDINRLSKKDDTGYHLSLFEGNTDLNLIKSLIPKDAWVTLETKQDIDKQKKEIAFLRK